MKYRKKPVVIDAVQYDGNFRCLDIFGISEVCDFIISKDEEGNQCIKIPTLEGEMTALIGDYIIRGVKGEFYPCKPDIFEMTYELASTSSQTENGSKGSDGHELDDDIPPTTKYFPTSSQTKNGSKGSELEPKTNLDRLPFPELVKELAKYYEKVPIIEAISSQTEISDEQIEIEGWKYCYENKISSTNIVHWITACKWYREQLKQKI